jgi:hypothetical protein
LDRLLESDPNNRVLRGRCERGTVRYRIADTFLYAANCPCPMGSLVDAPSIRPTHHIFVGSKAPWFEITDDLPQSEEHAT